MYQEIKFPESVKTEEVLIKGSHLISPGGIIKSFQEKLPEPSDPKLFHFFAEISVVYPTTPSFQKTKSLMGKPKRIRLHVRGASINRKRAIAKTIGEAVERYCAIAGFLYHRKNMIFASYKDIRNSAVDPRVLTKYSDKQYQKDNFRLHKFSENLKMWWIRGHSLLKRCSIWVPASFVFIGPIAKRAINIPISTGLASADTLDEAVLSGIYEVIERDAFTIMWLNKLSMPAIRLDTIENEKILEILRRFSSANLEIFINNITTDIEVPTFFTMLINRTGDSNVPAAVVAAGANLNPEIAALHALEEVGLIHMGLRWIMKANPDYEIPDDFMKMKSMQQGGRTHGYLRPAHEHPLIYSKAEMLPTLGFLMNPPRKMNINEINNMSSSDPRKDLRTCSDILSSKKLDLIVVDITLPTLADLGFSVVKVIIPDLQPLHFFPNYRCLGGQRLFNVPKILGYTHRKTTEQDLNPYPHPFA